MADTEAEAIRAAEAMTEALEAVHIELKHANRYGKQSRRMIWVLVCSLILDVALTIVLAVFAVQAHDANIQAKTATATSLTLCKAANTSRAQQHDLWLYLLTKGRPAAGRAFVRRFEEHLDVVFAPRDCTALIRRPR